MEHALFLYDRGTDFDVFYFHGGETAIKICEENAPGLKNIKLLKI